MEDQDGAPTAAVLVHHFHHSDLLLCTVSSLHPGSASLSYFLVTILGSFSREDLLGQIPDCTATVDPQAITDTTHYIPPLSPILNCPPPHLGFLLVWISCLLGLRISSSLRALTSYLLHPKTPWLMCLYISNCHWAREYHEPTSVSPKCYRYLVVFALFMKNASTSPS